MDYGAESFRRERNNDDSDARVLLKVPFIRFVRFTSPLITCVLFRQPLEDIQRPFESVLCLLLDVHDLP